MFAPTEFTGMTELELAGVLASRNLAVGTWTNQKGEEHISITRMGRYNKNIAVPVEMVPALLDAMSYLMGEKFNGA
jgi:hypothetical protein